MRPLIGVPCRSHLRHPKHLSGFCVRQTWCEVLQAAGATPVPVPLLDDEHVLVDLYRRLDGLVLAGGGDVEPEHFGERRASRLIEVDPPRDRVELFLTRRAVQDGLPLLGVCRGVQVLNVALGGTLYQDVQVQVPNALQHKMGTETPRDYLAHDVEVHPGTRLAAIIGPDPVAVNSFHHQSVRDVARELRVAASAPDGVIEALEGSAAHFVLGVQWHPEDMVPHDARMKGLFEAFVEAAHMHSSQSE